MRKREKLFLITEHGYPVRFLALYLKEPDDYNRIKKEKA